MVENLNQTKTLAEHSMNFQPQRVDAKSVFYWFREGLDLSIRKLLIFITLTLIFCGIDYLPLSLNQSLIFLIPMLLGLGCIVAYCADAGYNILVILRSKPIKVWFNLFYIGFIPWIPLIILSIFLVFLSGDVKGDAFVPVPPKPTDFNGGSALFALMFLWFICMGYLIWFIIPLVAIAELPLVIAFEQAGKALGLNKFVIFLVIFFSFSCFFGIILPLIVFPWVAIVTSMMYTSYRHIWLDRGLNYPAVFSKQLSET